MSFPRYPEYRDSGVEWLGEVPEHWEVKRLRHLVECLDGKRVPLNSAERADRPGDVPYWGANAIMGYVDQPLFDEELVLLGEDGAPFFDPFRPVAFRSLGPVWPNNHIHVLRPNQTTFTKFIVYCLNVTDYANFIDGSTRDKLTQAGMNSIRLPWPSRDEALLIATFLDRETAKIDALVAEQEKLIALLQEKRQAVISHAVTKGLDPNVPMKDSGVEWLGEVPGHWEVKQLRHIAKIVRGASPRPAGDPKFFTSEPVIGQTTPWVTVAEITKDAEIYLRDVKEYLTVLGAESSQFFPSGTLVFTNSGATLGVPKVLAIDCCANDGVLAFRDLSASIDILFAYHFLSTTTDRLRTEMKQGGGQPNLNTDIVKNIGIALPPRDEQDAIVGYLACENTKFDVLVTEARTAITLLQERRTALISAAVTGQIDVRGLAGGDNAPDSVAASAYPASV
ncbi:MAG: restriction endonuclease subunit S [Simplicispira suum]|uniref:restriction endonuclease subunit S n=1 Tax=Simplicispira suum TaxID=2109915 RepID=UPI001C6A923F|nr:restriction endonuclease subunit S [Simplicispira suum]MBW7832115.1 restriction endonuclease subunit S [Simplicispira suum]